MQVPVSWHAGTPGVLLDPAGGIHAIAEFHDWAYRTCGPAGAAGRNHC